MEVQQKNLINLFFFSKLSLFDLREWIFFELFYEDLNINFLFQIFLDEFFESLFFELFHMLYRNLSSEFFLFFQKYNFLLENVRESDLICFFFFQLRFQFFFCNDFIYEQTFHSFLFCSLCGDWYDNSEIYRSFFNVVYTMTFLFFFHSFFWFLLFKVKRETNYIDIKFLK